MNSYLGTDTETGGFYPGVHALLSLALVCRWAEPLVIYITVESQPGKSVDPEAAALNGYTPELWAERGAVPLCEAMSRAAAYVEARKKERPGLKVVAHNAGFEKAFLEEAERVTGTRLGITRHDWRCSMMLLGELMDWGLVPQGSGKLERLGVLSGFGPEGWQDAAVHDALHDAHAGLHGYEWLQGVRKRPEAALKELYMAGVRQRGEMELVFRELQAFMDTPMGSPWPDVAPQLAAVTRHLAAPGSIGQELGEGVMLVLKERARQQVEEGLSRAEDRRYIDGELRDAAIAYLMVCDDRAGEDARGVWPWPEDTWKPSEDAVRNLVRAAALVAAEIDRLLSMQAAEAVRG